MCNGALAVKDICWHCFDWNSELEASAEKLLNAGERLKSYGSDRFLVDLWVEIGLPEDKAIAQVCNSSYVQLLLWHGHLDHILADRCASDVLKELLETNQLLLKTQKELLAYKKGLVV